MHNRTLTRARNRAPITFRFEPAGFGEGNAQPTLWKRWRRLNTLATTMNWDFCGVIHSALQTMTSCLISRGGIFENDEDKYDCQSCKKQRPQMKPLAKKRYNLADLGDFEGFVDLYPGRSVHSEISSTPVLLSDAV